jgi:hypothetical protein
LLQRRGIGWELGKGDLQFGFGRTGAEQKHNDQQAEEDEETVKQFFHGLGVAQVSWVGSVKKNQFKGRGFIC